MDLESTTKDVEAVGVDSGEQEIRPKKAYSGGTNRVPGKSGFPVAGVQKIQDRQGWQPPILFATYLRELTTFDLGTTYGSERGRLSRLNGYCVSIVGNSFALNM